MVAGAGDPHHSSNLFVHGDSPNTGAAWCAGSGGTNVVTFDKLKLTNNRSSLVSGHLCLHSMHRYQPVVHVQEVGKEQECQGESRKCTQRHLN